MKKAELIKLLKELNACKEAVEYVKQSKYKTLQGIWNHFDRGDWMLWYIGEQVTERGSKTHKQLVLAACQCARLSLKYVPKNEKRPLKAVETAEKWTKGKATLEEVRSASYVAYDADDAYAAAYATFAAYAAAYAADAAAAYNAAAAAATYAAAAAVADAVTKKTLKQCADVVREYFPTPESEVTVYE